MKKIYSLKNKQLFQKVLSEGKKWYSEYFSIFYLPNDETKIGISIPKKHGDAVFRNKQKRQIKNIIGNFQNLNLIKKNFIIIVKKPFYDLSFEKKEQIIINLLNKFI
ncbi:ribonuclease P protein component [Candidatus Hepatoplasma crinochetorum]|jgi:ribonuclease P protein component|uniref:Ribonuclease P protein component n=1 Tax=Candidatus Hepatoplasma crinochetorum Av TaxID=1427984 RepID=W8GFZ6_9MOLU|nr:ribonuclease P protein component [Candidatus Hepatoplasma crinochetorum]AHK22704.1 Ribonuclease P protein component [Candidatus Hepatoplasma crinochetorum Av]BDV03278.1 MAG: hypothetical protein HCTKY_5720 [Candidatus Hepatoplasma crinochetorum]